MVDVLARAHEPAARRWLESQTGFPVGTEEEDRFPNYELGHVLDAFEAGVVERLHLAIMSGDHAAWSSRVLHNFAEGKGPLTPSDARRCWIVVDTCWNELGEARALLNEAAARFREYETIAQNDMAGKGVTPADPWVRARRNGDFAARIERWLTGEEIPAGCIVGRDDGHARAAPTGHGYATKFDDGVRGYPVKWSGITDHWDEAPTYAVGDVVETEGETLVCVPSMADQGPSVLNGDTAGLEAVGTEFAAQAEEFVAGFHPEVLEALRASAGPVYPSREYDMLADLMAQTHEPFIGKKVEKRSGDYRFDGEIRAVIVKRSGEVRYAVEDDRGLLLVMNAKQCGIEPPTTEN